MIQEEIRSKAIKKAKVRYPVNDLIRKRWSARAFSSKPIEHETLMTLFEAASWAPSSMNEQPWVYLYATRDNPDRFEQFSSCLMEGNRKWAKDTNVLVLSLARKTFQKNGSPNRHSLHDVGAANTQLLLQAADLDIYGHMMGGYDREKTNQLLEIPDSLETVCFIALGYLNDPDNLEEPFRSRELAQRERKSLSEFIYQNELV